MKNCILVLVIMTLVMIGCQNVNEVGPASSVEKIDSLQELSVETNIDVESKALGSREIVEIKVATADVKNAGTNDNVWVRFGNGSLYYKVKLDKSWYDDLERGTTTTYTIWVNRKILGPIKWVQVIKDGTDGWKPSTIHVQYRNKPNKDGLGSKWNYWIDHAASVKNKLAKKFKPKSTWTY